MNEEEYKEWKNQISQFMTMQKEPQDFIEFTLDWFDGMKGSEEVSLILEYHSEFKGKKQKEAFDFILTARNIPKNFKGRDFNNQNFNSAFFLYRPLLKLAYINSNHTIKK